MSFNTWTLSAEPVVLYCWLTIYAIGPALEQHRGSTSAPGLSILCEFIRFYRLEVVCRGSETQLQVGDSDFTCYIIHERILYCLQFLLVFQNIFFQFCKRPAPFPSSDKSIYYWYQMCMCLFTQLCLFISFYFNIECNLQSRSLKVPQILISSEIKCEKKMTRIFFCSFGNPAMARRRLLCKGKKQYLLTCKVSRYCLLLFQSSTVFWSAGLPVLDHYFPQMGDKQSICDQTRP